jgi:hypothetical protein
LGVAVGVAVGGTGVLVGVAVGVAVGGTGVLVGVAVGVAVGGTGVLVGVGVLVAVGVAVGVLVDVAVGVGVGLMSALAPAWVVFGPTGQSFAPLVHRSVKVSVASSSMSKPSAAVTVYSVARANRIAPPEGMVQTTAPVPPTGTGTVPAASEKPARRPSRQR